MTMREPDRLKRIQGPKTLVYLAEHEGISQVQLAELTDLEPMTLVRTLDYLESQGLLERRNDLANRRARRLYHALIGLSTLAYSDEHAALDLFGKRSALGTGPPAFTRRSWVMADDDEVGRQSFRICNDLRNCVSVRKIPVGFDTA
jgi:hypothetical protein